MSNLLDRPKVVLYVCASLDGRITFGPNSTMFDAFRLPELYQMLCTNEEWESFSKAVFSIYKPDMFLEGSNMVIAENETLRELPKFDENVNNLFEDFLPADILNHKNRKTWTAIVDGRGRFRNGYTGVTDDPETYMVHLTTETVPPEYLAFLRSKNIPYIIEGQNKVNLPKVLQKVKTKLNVDTIVTSSGGRLSGALIRSSLLDEVNLLVSPIVIGGNLTPKLFTSPELNWPSTMPNRLTLLEIKNMKNDKIWLRYKVNY
ncbi:MAG TPA: dihydrofolate reductase family protein [Candidatus Cloacimonadota bacterium]|nr:dihydrofolate reductase family protein [Candidatus Cloacimonadota bacterium]